ncbi:hypothetical protein PENTCL1PPCAC_7736, partial [Pristionchus entomophagus]
GGDYFDGIVVCESLPTSANPCDPYDLVQTGKSADTCFSLHIKPESSSQAYLNCQHEGASFAVIHDSTKAELLMKDNSNERL